MTEKEFLNDFLNYLYAYSYTIHYRFSKSSAGNDEMDKQIDCYLAENRGPLAELESENAALKEKVAAAEDVSEAYQLELADAAERTREIEELKARAEEAEKYNTFNGQYEEYVTGEAFNAMEWHIQEKARADAAEMAAAKASETCRVALADAEAANARADAAEKTLAELREKWPQVEAAAKQAISDAESAEAEAGKLRADITAIVESLDAQSRLSRMAAINDEAQAAITEADRIAALLRAALQDGPVKKGT